MQPCPQGTDGVATHCHSSNGAAASTGIRSMLHAPAKRASRRSQCAVPLWAESGGRPPTDLPVIFVVFPFAVIYVSIRVGPLALHTRANNAI